MLPPTNAIRPLGSADTSVLAHAMAITSSSGIFGKNCRPSVSNVSPGPLIGNTRGAPFASTNCGDRDHSRRSAERLRASRSNGPLTRGAAFSGHDRCSARRCSAGVRPKRCKPNRASAYNSTARSSRTLDGELGFLDLESPFPGGDVFRLTFPFAVTRVRARLLVVGLFKSRPAKQVGLKSR
jgi:hypothetical protein